MLFLISLLLLFVAICLWDTKRYVERQRVELRTKLIDKQIELLNNSVDLVEYLYLTSNAPFSQTTRHQIQTFVGMARRFTANEPKVSVYEYSTTPWPFDKNGEVKL